MFSTKSLVAMGIICAAVACGKTKDKDNDSPRGNGDDAAPQAIEVGQEFGFTADLVATESGHGLVRHFTFTLPTEQNLRLRANSEGSACLGEGTVKDGVFTLVDASNTLKLSTAEAEGFSLVAKDSFPGQVGGNSYTLTATYAGDENCTIDMHYVLEVVPAQEKPAAEQPTPTNKPTPEQPKPEQPKPTDPVTPTDPTDPQQPTTSIDAAFAKNWKYEEAGFFSDLVNVGADGKATEKVTVQGSLYVDIEMQMVTDVSTTPDHLMMTVTKVNHADADANVHVGDVTKCIYQATATALKLECGEADAYPTAFSADATNYVLQ